jgi:hypothetical protein
LSSDTIIIYSLVALNLVLYSMLIFGYARTKRPLAIPDIQSANEVFAFLENSFKATFPEIQDGFTWPELISKAKSTALASPIDWRKVQAAVSDYEASRYGQKSEPTDFASRELLKLAVLLRRSGRVNS